MINEFWIDNFKSYKDTTQIPLTSLTFLIGANASGKSNVLEAIRFLKWLAQGKRLDEITRSQNTESLLRGQPNDLFHNTKRSFQLGCGLTDSNENELFLQVDIGLVSDQLIVSGESSWTPYDGSKLPYYGIDSKPNSHTDEVQVYYNNFKRGGKKPHVPCSNQQAIFYQLESPGRFNSDHHQSRRDIPAAAKELREQLRSISFLDPRPSAMRGYSWVKDSELKENGSNVSSVLHSICEQGQSSKDRLLEFVRALPEQDIRDIEFIETDRKDVMVRLVESFGPESGRIDAPLLSDGTLRVLAIAALLLSADEGSFVVIEEIDNGVHPSRAKALVESIQKVSEARRLRVLVTTHNPALLDALPDRSLADVLCCYRDPIVGDSRIVRLGDLPRYPELVAQASLGELVTTRVLDRFLKDNTPEQQRIQKSLQWLDELKKEAAE